MKNYQTNFLAFIMSSFLIVVMCGSLLAQNTNPPGLKYIKESELKKDLYTLADAHFNGRSAGTLDELKASMWLVEKYRSIGLLPAGDDGTYLQFFNLWRNHISDKSTIKINNVKLKLWNDVAISQMANASIVAPIMYLGGAADIDTTKLDIKNKVVAIEASSIGINLNVSLPTWRYSRSVQTKYVLPLIRKGATAVIIIADEIAEKAWDDAAENFKRGSYDIDGKYQCRESGGDGCREGGAAPVAIGSAHDARQYAFSWRHHINGGSVVRKAGTRIKGRCRPNEQNAGRISAPRKVHSVIPGGEYHERPFAARVISCGDDRGVGEPAEAHIDHLGAAVRPIGNAVGDIGDVGTANPVLVCDTDRQDFHVPSHARHPNAIVPYGGSTTGNGGSMPISIHTVCIIEISVPTRQK